MSDGCGFNANIETLLACGASSATLGRAVAPARRSLLNVVGWRRGHLATTGRNPPNGPSLGHAYPVSGRPTAQRISTFVTWASPDTRSTRSSSRGATSRRSCPPARSNSTATPALSR